MYKQNSSIYYIYWRKLGILGSRWQTPGKLWNEVLGRSGEDELHQSRTNLGRTRRAKEGRNILHKIKEGNLRELVTSCVGTAFKSLLK